MNQMPSFYSLPLGTALSVLAGGIPVFTSTQPQAAEGWAAQASQLCLCSGWAGCGACAPATSLRPRAAWHRLGPRRDTTNDPRGRKAAGSREAEAYFSVTDFAAQGDHGLRGWGGQGEAGLHSKGVTPRERTSPSPCSNLCLLQDRQAPWQRGQGRHRQETRPGWTGQLDS